MLFEFALFFFDAMRLYCYSPAIKKLAPPARSLRGIGVMKYVVASLVVATQLFALSSFADCQLIVSSRAKGLEKGSELFRYGYGLETPIETLLAEKGWKMIPIEIARTLEEPKTDAILEITDFYNDLTDGGIFGNRLVSKADVRAELSIGNAKSISIRARERFSMSGEGVDCATGIAEESLERAMKRFTKKLMKELPDCSEKTPSGK